MNLRHIKIIMFTLSYFFALNVYATEVLKLPLSISQNLPEKVRVAIESKRRYQKQQDFTPYPRFCRSLCSVDDICINSVDATNILSFSTEQGNIVYQYVGIDPSFYIKDTIDASNAQEFLDYIHNVEQQNLQKSRTRNAHKYTLLNVLKGCYQNNLKAPKESMPIELDTLLNINETKTIKWVDIVYVDDDFNEHLYLFSCGNLNCTISYGGVYGMPKIRWSCQNGSSGCPLNNSFAGYRDLTQNEIFNFILILSEQNSPLDVTLLTETQHLLKEQIRSLAQKTESTD